MNKLLSFLKSNWQDILKPVTVLLVICIVISASLALTNSVTNQKIASLAEKTQKETMSQLIKADSFNKKVYNQNKGDSFEYFEAVKQDKACGYIFVTSQKGYGGEISVMTAVNTKGKVTRVAILSADEETPGLGQNVKTEGFLSQFKNKLKNIELVKNNADSQNNQINAVTGATISSKAVTKAVNLALERYSLAVKTDTSSDTATPETDSAALENTAQEAETVETQ